MSRFELPPLSKYRWVPVGVIIGLSWLPRVGTVVAGEIDHVDALDALLSSRPPPSSVSMLRDAKPRLDISTVDIVPNVRSSRQAPAEVMAENPPVDTTYQSTINPDAIQHAPGMGISYCPGLSCIVGITDGHQRASMVISGKTKLDGEAQEQLLALSMTTRTGRLINWTARTGYNEGNNLYNPNGDNVYRVLNKCVSGASPPTHARDGGDAPSKINGTCRLLWINKGAIAAKIAAYFENEVEAGAGNAWTQANNFIMRPNAPTNFNINTEFDFSNFSGKDCQLGENCTAVRIGMGGANKATAGIEIASDGTATTKTIWGLRFSNVNLASDALIALDSNAKYGIAANQLGLGGDAYSGALILDNSTGPATLLIANRKTEASIVDRSPNSGATLVSENSRSKFDLGLGASAPLGVKLHGVYSQAALDTQYAKITAQGGFPTAIVRSGDQQDCYSGFNVCQRYDTSLKTFATRINGTDMLSLSSAGNVAVAGTVKVGAFTVAKLPTCDTTSRFAVASVSDAEKISYRGSVSGGGRDVALVLCTGSAWIYH